MFCIDDYDELLALNRALMEARYLADKVDTATRGSSFLSAMHERVIDEIVKYHEAQGVPRKANSWREWRKFATRSREREAIVDHLSAIWQGMKTADLRQQMVVNQVRPFTISREEIDELVEQISLRSAQRLMRGPGAEH